MAIELSILLAGAADQLRYEPTPKRIRAFLDGRPAVDTTRALLVWEPHHVVPAYAVPRDELNIELAERREGARGSGVRLQHSELDGYALLDFDSFDEWQEEDDVIVAHPHDPFHRVDLRASSRRVRITFDGQVIAESSRPVMLFETLMPVRFYLPREDVRVPLVRSDTSTTCAYKGRAAYFSARLGDRMLEDIAWTLPEPLPEGFGTEGRIAFFNERVDIEVERG
jgi:uncharacterized protein (DUF427 family)